MMWAQGTPLFYFTLTDHHPLLHTDRPVVASQPANLLEGEDDEAGQHGRERDEVVEPQLVLQQRQDLEVHACSPNTHETWATTA